MAIAKKHNLVIIEDACQSHGATYKGKRLGSFGTGAFSLYPTKNMTSAEGGMITTDDDALDAECRIIRQHGMRRRYYHDELGFNFRMTDVHAAIGLEQLKKLTRFNEARQRNAAFLSEHLRGVAVPVVPMDSEHVYHQYTVRVPVANAMPSLSTSRSKSTRIWRLLSQVPVHKQSYYTKELKYDLSLPEFERAAAEVLSLPVHPSLSPADLESIVSAVNEFMAPGS